jgi:hypothetical protein
LVVTVDRFDDPLPLHIGLVPVVAAQLFPHHLSKRFATVYGDCSFALRGALLPLGAVLALCALIDAYRVALLMGDHNLELHGLSFRADHGSVFLLEVVFVVFPATSVLKPGSASTFLYPCPVLSFA